MPDDLSSKILDHIAKAGLPTNGPCPFRPKLGKNQQGEPVILKRAVQKGPKRGKRGYVDDEGRVWIKDRSHAGLPDHWDVQINDGEEYIRVDMGGNEIP